MTPFQAISLGLTGLGSVANFIGGAQAERQNERMLERQITHADQAAAIAFHRQNQLMDRENLYNDPSQQMERLKKAGLNPYLLYGDQSAFVQSSSKSAQQAANPSPVAMPNYYAPFAQSLQGAAQQMVEFKRLENETKVADAQALNLSSNAGVLRTQEEFNRRSMDWRVDAAYWAREVSATTHGKLQQDTLIGKVEEELKRWQSKNAQATQSQIQAQTDYILAQTSAQHILNRYLPQRQSAELSQIAANIYQAYRAGRMSEVSAGLEGFKAATARIAANAADRSQHSSAANQRHATDTYKEISTKVTEKDVFNAAASTLGAILGRAAEGLSKPGAIPIRGFGQ